MAIPLQKRANDLFVSYGHADAPVIDPIVGWLKRWAGLQVWYDKTSGDASKRSSRLLAEGLQSARGSVFCLSRNWTASTWCEDEHDVALTERRENDAYLVLGLRFDDVEIPPWFKVANVLDFRRFDLPAAAGLLRSLSPNAPTRVDNRQDLYFAGPWSRPSDAAKATLRILQQQGWRIVGDSPEYPYFQDAAARIRAIIATARGVTAVLPYDVAHPPHFTSPWILEEVRIARAEGKPYLLLAEDRVQLPPELAADAFGGMALPLPPDGPGAAFSQTLQDFDEELDRRPYSDARAYSFLAASLLEEQQDTTDLVSVVERATNMPCVRGQSLSGQHVQQAIVDRIREAAFVIADVTDDRRNTLIEAGVAMGADRPLHLLCRTPDGGPSKTRFMFQDREMEWYRTPMERVGAVYRMARPYRRRVFAAAN